MRSHAVPSSSGTSTVATVSPATTSSPSSWCSTNRPQPSNAKRSRPTKHVAVQHRFGLPLGVEADAIRSPISPPGRRASSGASSRTPNASMPERPVLARRLAPQLGPESLGPDLEPLARRRHLVVAHGDDPVDARHADEIRPVPRVLVGAASSRMNPAKPSSCANSRASADHDEPVKGAASSTSRASRRQRRRNRAVDQRQDRIQVEAVARHGPIESPTPATSANGRKNVKYTYAPASIFSLRSIAGDHAVQLLLRRLGRDAERVAVPRRRSARACPPTRRRRRTPRRAASSPRAWSSTYRSRSSRSSMSRSTNAPSTSVYGIERRPLALHGKCETPEPVVAAEQERAPVGKRIRTGVLVAGTGVEPEQEQIRREHAFRRVARLRSSSPSGAQAATISSTSARYGVARAARVGGLVRSVVEAVRAGGPLPEVHDGRDPCAPRRRDRRAPRSRASCGRAGRSSAPPTSAPDRSARSSSWPARPISSGFTALVISSIISG